MPFSIAPVTSTTARRAVDILFETFQHQHPYLDAFFPHHSTPAGRDSAALRLLARSEADHTVKHLLVVDEESGEAVAQGTWQVVDARFGDARVEAEGGGEALEGGVWDCEDDREWAGWLEGEFHRKRRTRFREAKGLVFAVGSLSVLSEHQGQGAGSLLMRWGLEQADAEVDAECVVESAVGSVRFYEKWGFVVEEEVTITNPEKWRGRPEQSYVWMTRAAKMPGKSKELELMDKVEQVIFVDTISTVLG